MIYNFYCKYCKRECDPNCVSCEKYNELLLDRLHLFEEGLLRFKDNFDNCSDSDPIKRDVRLSMAESFDTAVCLFDDIFNDPSYYLSFDN